MTGKEITILILVSIGVFLANLDGSIVNITLPTLLKYFNVDTSTVSIVVVTYLLAISIFLLFFGKLSDIKGARKIFMSGFAVFLLASLFCTFSPNIYVLSLCRFIQGTGGAMLSATFGALILQYLSPEIRGRAFGLIAVAGGTGFAVGAPLGGFLIKYFDWKWVFYINIPICAIAFFMAYVFLPEKKIQEGPETKIDMISVVLSFIWLGAITMALNRIDTESFKSPFVMGSFMVFLFTFLLFIYRQIKIPSPLIDVRLFKNRSLSVGITAGFLTGMIISGSFFLFPFYFEFVRNLNPARAGMFLMIIPILSTLLGPLAGYCSDKYGPRTVTLSSTSVMIISIIMISFFNSVISIYYIIISFIIFGTALAFFLTANMSFIMGYAPEGKEGITSAIVALSGALSASTGISIFAAIFSYYTSVAGHPGKEPGPVPVIKAFHICFICFIVLAILVFITIFFTGERKEKNGILRTDPPSEKNLAH